MTGGLDMPLGLPQTAGAVVADELEVEDARLQTVRAEGYIVNLLDRRAALVGRALGPTTD